MKHTMVFTLYWASKMITIFLTGVLRHTKKPGSFGEFARFNGGGRHRAYNWVESPTLRK